MWNLHRVSSTLLPVHVILWVELFRKYPAISLYLGPYNVDITGDLQNILGGNSVPSVRAGY